MLLSAQLAQEAINAALECNWNIAKQKNLQILDDTPEDVCALNRLARACFELGDTEVSKQYYQKVLQFDPYNSVAIKNFKRLSTLKDYSHVLRSSTSTLLSFIEEPGKTKIVQLVKAAAPDVLVTLRSGEEVMMVQKSRGMHVACSDGTYIGRLPDDTAYNLIQLQNAGNIYTAFLKQVLHNKVFVFIKEHYRNELVMPHPSFPQAYGFSSGYADAQVSDQT